MATSGSTSFNPAFDDICEDAYSRCGMQFGDDTRGGYDIRNARRSANLLSLEWSNKGLNLWTVDSQTLALSAGVRTYALPADTFAVLDTAIRTTIGSPAQTSDLTISPMSFPEYLMQTNKFTQGRPLQYYVERATSGITLILWPVPDALLAYTLVYYRIRRIQDVNSIQNDMDIPAQYLPAFVSGMAFHVGAKHPKQIAEAGVGLGDLKARYEEDFALAEAQSSQRVSVRMVPRNCY